MWCSGVRWVSSLLIPPLFLTHNTARPGLSLYKEQDCQICDIILISVRREGTLPCAVASSSERALFSVTEMITQMGGRDAIWAVI